MEIRATKMEVLEGNQDFVFLEKTSDKARYSTLKLQELNAKLKALQDEHEQVQRALSEDLCNQVLVIGMVTGKNLKPTQSLRSHTQHTAASLPHPR